MSRSGGSRDSGTHGSQALHCEIDGVRVTLLAEDLTTAGLFIQTLTPHAMDCELEIVLRSSMGELIARGQVVQVVNRERAQQEARRPGFGLLFISLEDDQRAFIGLTLDALTRTQRAAQAEAIKVANASAKPPVMSVKPPVPSAKPPALSTKPPPPSSPPAELKQVAAELRAELNKLQGKPAWTALGLEADSPLVGAKEAFLRLSMRFHPHKFARHNSAEISQLATEVFIAYKRAYSVLTKLAPRVAANAQEQARAAQRPLTSIAPAAGASLRPAGPRPAGNRTRTR